jgi:hypothetical protein
MSWRGIAGAATAVAAAIGTAIVWTAGADGEVPPSSVAGDGGALFDAKGCAGCHVGPGGDPDDFVGFPDLSDASAWAGARRPGMSATEYIAESIRDPEAFTSPAFTGAMGPVAGMPTLDVSEEEIDALVEYLLES